MTFSQSLLIAFFVAMVPVLELRAAVFLPWGVLAASGAAPTVLQVLLIYAVTLAGNLIPVPLILFFVPKVLDFLERFRFFAPFVGWLRKKADKHSEKILRGAFWGLFAFVFLPIPGTGAWTGSLVASLFDIPKKRSLPAVMLGVVFCGILMNLICYLFLYQGVHWLRFFIKQV